MAELTIDQLRNKEGLNMRDIGEWCDHRGVPALAQGMIELPPPEKLRNILATQIMEGPQEIHQYRARKGESELVEGLIKLEKELHGLTVTKDQILVTSGVSAANAAVMLLMRRLKKNPVVGVFVPFYTYHLKTVLECMAEEPVFIDMKPDFTPDLEKVEEAIKTKKIDLLFFSHPGNPTGQVWPADDVRKLAALVKKYDIYAIFDEIYVDLVWGAPFHSPLADEIHPKIISCRGFSKTLGAQSWRVGYVLSTPETINLIAAVHDPVYICAPLVQQAVGKYMKEEFDDLKLHFQNVEKLLRQNSEILKAAFEKRFGWKPVVEPKGAMYVWFSHNEESDLDAVFKALDAGVGIAPGNIFFPGTPKKSGFLRIHTGISLEKAQKISDILTK